MKLAARGILAAIVLLPALGASPSGAGAHAEFIRSDPADGQSVILGPPEVIFWYTEAIEVNSSDAYVVDASGKRWELPTEDAFHIHNDPTNPGLLMVPNMPSGEYTVVWDMLSAVDDHRTDGSFTFFVGSGGDVSNASPTFSVHNPELTSLLGADGGNAGSNGQGGVSSSDDNGAGSTLIFVVTALAVVLVVGAAVTYAISRRRAQHEGM
jgi:methionine-rich copper-binding protein CopC